MGGGATMHPDEYSKAISFANGYFALVDGLVHGLDDHLAEDARLEWFGRVVGGRKNVAAFMRAHMRNSKHIFAEIIPTANIVSRIDKLPRQKCNSEGNLVETIGNVTDGRIESELNLAGLRIEDNASNAKDKIDLKLSDGDPEYLFPKDAAAQRAEGAKRREKTYENRVEDEDPAIYDNGLIKFVQARGIVQYDRRSVTNKFRKWRFAGFASGETCHTWRRPCTLRIAYATNFGRTAKSEAELARSIMRATVKDAWMPMNCGVNVNPEGPGVPRGRKRSKSSNDTFETTSGSEGNFVPFEDLDRHDDRQRFLEFFEAEIAAGDSKVGLTTPKYIGDRLVFDWTGSIDPECEENSKGFKFDYCIQKIVYECNMECKLNLSQELDLGETEKRG